MNKIEDIQDWSAIHHALLSAEVLAEINYEDFVSSHGVDDAWTFEAKEALDKITKAREIFKKY